ncbi:NUDIX hydrolase [Stappia sp. F7233]|uniref:NUDIX hydrolase n=2 Tax=Stappia albiluteola TaxID=2758565 RepID=A0A839AGY8_9HYPH|nr:NUDIX hydrolase [Stappia albiluteola]
MGGKPPEVQCAALPWRRTEDGRIEVMIATSRDTGRWVLPKGWPHKRLTLDQSAAQEAYEEVGVVGDIAKEPFGTYMYSKGLDNGLSKRVQVAVFPMEVRGQLDEWPEQGQRRVAWVDALEAARLVDEPELSGLLRKFRG